MSLGNTASMKTSSDVWSTIDHQRAFLIQLDLGVSSIGSQVQEWGRHGGCIRYGVKRLYRYHLGMTYMVFLGTIFVNTVPNTIFI